MSSSTSRRETLATLARIILAVPCPHPVRVAIDGVDAVGKTTLADELAALMGARSVIRASIDGFHNPRAVRYVRGRYSPEGYYRDSFDTEGLLRELLRPLASPDHFLYRTAFFDYRKDARVFVPQREASKNSILLFDGVFLLTPTLRPEWDFVVFVHAPFDITVSRAVERQRRERALSAEDEEALRKEYRERYVPGQQLYLQEVRPATIADAVIDNANLAYPTLHIRPR